MPDSSSEPSTTWGSWYFNPSALTLELRRDGLPAHSIQLRTITSSACMLDAIFGLKNTPWADNNVIGDLVAAFQDLFDPQVNLCGEGRDRTFDPLSHLNNGWIH